MKVFAFKYAPVFVCLLALFIICEIVNYSEGFPTGTLFREKRANGGNGKSLSKQENKLGGKKKSFKKNGSGGIVGTLKNAKKSLDNKSISGTTAIGVALAGVAAGTLVGTVGGRVIEKNQQEAVQQFQQYNGGGFVPNYPLPAIMPQQFMPPMIPSY
ncbi:unnamed protein product [Meloidogyne enterolobii]|uniref:Uncharacterized protein n=1 Tax=Meloidogyne enterolobii TaxID=390850 RepID=A0ACB0Y4Q7_MELEN